MTKIDNCSVAGCEQPEVSSLNGEALCRGHFISVCYACLDQCKEMPKWSSLTVSGSESIRHIIHECIRQANQIVHGARDLNNLDRARLLHIIEEANDLGRYLRRSPREVASVAVRLCCERIGGSWEENTKTVRLSRYGASVQCSHPAKPGEILQVIRTDTGQKAQARVTCREPSVDGSVRMGVEFIDCDNFWGLDWEPVEEAR